MKTTHTPAPWIKEVTDSGLTFVNDQNNEEIAIVSAHQGCYEANSNLISAAPELLDACESVLTTLSQMTSDSMIEGMKMVLEMAISKAKG